MANKFLDITPDQAKQIEDASNSRSQTDQETGQVEDVFFAKLGKELKKEKRKDQSLQRQNDYQQQTNAAPQPDILSQEESQNRWAKLWQDLDFDQARPDPVKYVRGDDGVFRAEDNGLAKFIAMDAKKQAVGNVLDAVYANGQSVEEYKDILDRARALNISPSQLLSADPETNKSIDKTIERGSIKIADLDTPVTLDIFSNYHVAALGRDSIPNVQLMEWKLSKIRTDERLEAEFKAMTKQSAGFNNNNFYYGFRKNSLFLQSVMYWMADFLEYGGQYGADRRNDKLVSAALSVEDLPHDLRASGVGEAFDKNGLTGAAEYIANNLGMLPSLLAQFAPSLAFGGAGGKGGSAIMSRLLANRAMSAGAKDYLMYTSAMSATLGTTTALGSYSGNLAQAYQATGNTGEAVKRARTRTSIEAGTDALFGFTPLPSQFIKGIRATGVGNIANVLTSTVAQSTSAGIGTYAGAKAVGDQVTQGEIFTNVFMNALFAPLELATAAHTGGRDFGQKAAIKQQAILSTIDDLKQTPLAKHDLQTANEVFKNLHTAYNNGSPKEVFISPENFTRYFQEKGVDPNELAKRATGKENALEQANTTGTDLVIPIEKYAELEMEVGAELRQDVKTEVDGVTLREHNQFAEENRQRAEQLVNNAVEAANKVTADLASNPIYSNIKQQLLDVGRITKTAEAEANIFYSAFDNIAKQAGLDAVDLFNRYNLKITKDGFNREGATILGQHFFLNMLSDIENMGISNDNIKSINNTFKKWLKADDLRSLTTEQHEQFARGFEAYLFEGKAPSIELKGAFKLVKQWMRSVYKMLTMLNVRLNNDVRQAFDRILASDEAIKLAEAYNQDLFATAERMGVSQKEFDVYKQIQKQAHENAEERLTTKALKEITREKTTQWKEESQQLKEQITNDFQENNNLYVLDDFLTKGIVSEDGNKIVQKLDRNTIKEIYGDEIAEQLKRFTQKDGLPPDDIAKQFNFNSADDMIQQLISKPSNKDMIDSEIKRVMLKRHGDMLNDGSIEQQAIEAVQTEDARAKLLHAEELAIRKQSLLVNKVNKAKSLNEKEAKQAAYASIAPDSLLREISDQTVSSTKITDLKPDLYLQAMRKANRETVKAVEHGDWEAAAKTKEQERLNYHLYKNALKGVRSADAAYNFVKMLNRKTTREMINKSSPEALDQIDRLTEQYQFKNVSGKEITFRQNLRNYLDALEAEGRAIDVPDYILDNHLSTNYRELTVEQLQGLHDTLKGLVNVARMQNKLIADGKIKDFNEFKEEAVKSILVNNPVNARAKATSGLSETKSDYVANEINKFNVGMADIATICQRLDGGDAGGIMSRGLYKKMLDAELKMRGMVRKYQQRINQILAKQDGTYFKQKTPINSLGGHMIAKGEAIMMALNSGNASNKSRLLTGGLKTKDSVRALPLTDQAISEVLGTLNKQDWELVKGIWQMFEDMKPETKELYRQLNGFEFKEVEAGTIQTQYGEIKGGYFPLIYDRDVAIVPDGVQKQTVFKEGRTSALTNNGYTKARADKVTGTLNLNLDIFPTKLNEHILDLTHRKALIDANKILTNPEISAAIKEKMGVNYYNSLFQSIYSIANPDNSKGIGAWASALAKNTAVYQLGFSLKTVINQYAGAFQLLKYVNAVDYAREIANVAGGNYTSTLEHIKELSPMMADRWASMDLSHSALSKLEGKGKIAVGHENLQTIALAFMPVCERTFSVPAWMAIYKREIASGKTSEQAVMVADAAIVKSQGGFLNINKNAIQRNKAYTPFMMFASPFIAAYNGFVDSVHSVKQGKSSAIKEVMTNLAVVSLAGFGYSLMTGQKDDDEGYAKFYLKSSLSYATAGIPFVRDIVNFTVDAKGRSAISVPMASTLTNAVVQAKKVITNTDKAKAEAVLGAGAAVTGTPLKPLVVQGAAIKDLATGDYKPTDFLDGVRHLLYRNNKPK